MLVEVVRGFAEGRPELVAASLKALSQIDPDRLAEEAAEALALGLSMIADDARDLGRLDRPHHWLWGLLLAALGAALLALPLIPLLWLEDRA